MSKSNFDEKNKTRLVNLDFLRGLFVILALDQHFTYYINMWYVSYFRDVMALTSTYKINFPMIGHQISTDRFNLMLGIIFTPWVSQVYLTMASFNLARKPSYLFRDELASKLKMFGLIFIFFTLENFIVAPNSGEAISFYPIMLWMVVMSIISIFYSLMGIRGVLLLTLISFLRWVVPIDMLSNLFQSIIRYNIHPGFEYDARIEYFFSSGCLGFIMGHAHYHMPNYKKVKDFYFMLLGLVFVLFYWAYGIPYIIDPSNAFAHEHDMAQSFSGTLFILGVQAFVISTFLWLEKKEIRFNVPIFTWVGANSLLVFALHRVFFVKFLAPVSLMVGSMLGRPIGASTYELYSYVGLTIAFCYFVKATRLNEILVTRKG